MKIELDPTMAEVLPIFLAESGEGIEAMEAAVLRLEQAPGDRRSVDEVFRVVHTIKGDSASLGFVKMADFAHHLENGLDRLRAGAATDEEIVQILLEAVDELRKAMAAVDRHQDRVTAAQKRLQKRLVDWMAETRGTTSPSPAPETVQLEPDDDEKGISVNGGNRFIRVDVAKLDQLLTLVGEVAVARGGLTETLESRAGHASVMATHQSADRLHLELQELVMRVRMVPVGPAFRRHQRLVRDLAMKLEKKAMLEVQGGDVELDSSVLQLLQDPLSHMLRNAVHHGLEMPTERVEVGKPEQGRIHLRTRQEGGSIVIELEDDGRGIDRAKLKDRAERAGLLEPSAEPSDQDLLQLIFEPGLSTSDEVTDVSGRGVGMDVVRRNLEKMRSTIEVESEPGQSTMIRIQVPLTLAIVDGLVVRCRDEQYIAPTEYVMELVDLNGDDCREEGGILNLRGEALDGLRLRSVLGSPESGEVESSETVIVLRSGVFRIGLIVDEILAKTQVVIKPLPKALTMVPALAGTSVLGSGRIAFLLDIHNLVRGLKQRVQPVARMG